MSNKKILVCDDEPHVVHVVATKLRNAGFEVITAADGEEALQATKDHEPDLFITDYQMPYLSGLELCKAMSNDPKTRAIPVILLTARGFSMQQEDLEGTSIRTILPKPFSPRNVLRTVKEILEGTVSPAGSSS